MRYILLVLLAFVTTFASAQVQFLGSPTTTVRNRGNFVSDSLFYLPKRTKAPSDTGALRYQISDSALYVWTGSAWRSTGTAGSAITGSGVAGYMPEFTTATNIDSTRLYHSAGRFAIGSTTTTNGVFNVYGGQAYFDTSLKVGTQTLLADEGKNEVYVNTTTDAGAFTLQINGGIYTTREGIYLDGFKDWQVETNNGSLLFYNRSTNVRRLVIDSAGILSVGAIDNDFGASAIFRINPNINETYIGSLIDYGNYTLQVDGNFYAKGTGTFTKEISATSATANAGNPSAATIYSGDDGSAIWRAALSLQHNADVTISAGSGIGIGFSPLASTGSIYYGSASIKAIRPNNTANNQNTDLTFITRAGASNTTTDTEKMRITSAGEVLIGTTTDAGAYALQVAGSIYNTTGAVFAASSGNVGIGVIATAYKLDVRGSGYFEKTDTIGSASLVVRGKSDLPDYGSSGSGILSLRDVEAAGYGNLNIGAYRNAPYGTYFQVDQGSATQPILLNPLGGDIIINSNSDAGAYALQVAGAIYNTTTITTGAPTSGSAKPWRLGEAATVSPTSPNRTIRVEIDGTVYYIHAKTTND